MDETSDHQVNPTQQGNNDLEQTVMGALADVKINDEVETKMDSNAVLIQTILRQNELLMSMLTSMNLRKEEVYWSPVVIKSLPVFSGKGKPNEASDWLKTLREAAILYRWPEASKLKVALVNLTGPARQWYIDHKFNSFFDFEEQFEKTFVNKLSAALRWKVLIDRIQGKDENILDYYHDKIRMCKDLELDIEDTKGLLMDGMRGVSNDFFEYFLCRSQRDEDELLIDIMAYVKSQNIKLQNKQQSSGIDGECSTVKTVSKQENNNSVNSDMITSHSKSHHRTCSNCGLKTQTVSDYLIEKRLKSECNDCGSTTHQQSDCPKQQKQKTKGRNAEIKYRKQSQGELSGETTFEMAYNVKLGLRFSSHGVIVDALVDSSSPISFIKSCFVKSRYRQPFKNNFKISDINGTQLNIQAMVIVDILMLDYNIGKKHIFYVVSDQTMLADCSLGRDGISGLNIVFGEAGTMMIKELECGCCNTN